MRILIIIVAIILVSCDNNSQNRKENKQIGKQFCKILNLPDSTLYKLTSIHNNTIKQTNVSHRLELSEAQRNMLFQLKPDAGNGKAYLYSIRQLYEDIFLLFVLLENISNETFYMITVNCSTTMLDYISFSEGDFFDVIDQNQESETGLFINKYFQLLNDTTISTRSIIKKETKTRKNRLVLKSQIDSLTSNYFINRKGKFELIHSDSVRLK